MIACDVVLLPPAEMLDRAIEINRKLVQETGDKGIILDRKKCLPHITLAMGCVKEEDLEEIDGILRGIAGDTPPVSLKTIPAGEKTSAIRIEKSRDIELLHEIMMIRL